MITFTLSFSQHPCLLGAQFFWVWFPETQLVNATLACSWLSKLSKYHVPPGRVFQEIQVLFIRQGIFIVDFICTSSKCWCFSHTRHSGVYFTQLNQLLLWFHIRTNLLYSRVDLLSRSHHPDKCALLNRSVCSLHCRWSSACSPLGNVSHSSSHSWVWEASHKTPLKEQWHIQKSILQPLCCLN